MFQCFDTEVGDREVVSNWFHSLLFMNAWILGYLAGLSGSLSGGVSGSLAGSVSGSVAGCLSGSHAIIAHVLLKSNSHFLVEVRCFLVFLFY